MKCRRQPGSLLVAALAVVFALNLASLAQNKRQLITEPIDPTHLISLEGNTRPEVNAINDRGAVPADFPLNRMTLLLRRPAETELAFRQYLDDLHTPGNPRFHRWLTAGQIGQRFGLAQQDVDTIKNWLRSQGFTVNTVYDNGVFIDFSGSAEQVSQAFHTEIHQLEVGGESHIANVNNPKIPEALAPAIVGVVSLNDFRPHTMMVKARSSVHDMQSGASSDYDTGNGRYALVPADLATIYNFPPHTPGKMGEGRTIVLVEDTDLYSRGDWQRFVNTFGLSIYHPGFRQTHPGPGCIPPGVTANDDEATLDAEWATAAAPAAFIKMASCADTLIFGGFIALENILQETPLPDAVSVSYGEPEVDLGAAYNAYIDDLYSTAGGEGVSIYAAAGDSGAAGNDRAKPPRVAYYGINLSGYASTPDNVAVGGTDFEDTSLNKISTYWNSSNNSLNYGSAKSYIPEIPWNDSCASALIAGHFGLSALAFCNTATGSSLWDTAAGSGGPSGCSAGAPSTAGIVGGSCAGYGKPFFQNSFPGIPADGVRGMPDVSLFAADGIWNHFYVFCFSDPANGGVPCTGAPNTWSGAGGTSFASPIWAGIQALLNQQINSLSGNPNYVFYDLARGDTNYTGGHCDGNSPSGPNSACIFYDVTPSSASGLNTDMDLPCAPLNGVLHNCYLPAGDTVGVLSTSNTTLHPAYTTGTGWDFATGIGTVNVQNLINKWPPPPSPGCTDENGIEICW